MACNRRRKNNIEPNEATCDKICNKKIKLM